MSLVGLFRVSKTKQNRFSLVNAYSVFNPLKVGNFVSLFICKVIMQAPVPEVINLF